jgi:uncharacterized membrane protein
VAGFRLLGENVRMDALTPVIQDWLGLALRWFHLIAGIGWIGSSFYFMWLDSALTPPAPARKGVEGELWMVHSGGFYSVEKRLIGPGEVPASLHWFKWEAALTWMSGISLLAVVYYLGGATQLLDANTGLSRPAAIGLSVGLIAAAWIVYDLLWTSPLAKGEGRAATALSFLLLFGAIFGLCRVFPGRAAYIHAGAMLGTLMVANVWMRILPAQQAMIAATQAGRTPDYTLGHRAKRRSVHNSYMTFPVLFMMISNHYPRTYSHPQNWLVLILMVFVGAGVRHAMIRRAKHAPADWVLAPAAAALAVVVWMTLPASPTVAAGGDRVAFADVQAVIARRCVACHAEKPTDAIFTVAPAAVTLDTPDRIKAQALQIKVRAVEMRTMPFENKTGMTDEERELLGHWVDQGAPVD